MARFCACARVIFICGAHGLEVCVCCLCCWAAADGSVVQYSARVAKISARFYWRLTFCAGAPAACGPPNDLVSAGWAAALACGLQSVILLDMLRVSNCNQRFQYKFTSGCVQRIQCVCVTADLVKLSQPRYIVA